MARNRTIYVASDHNGNAYRACVVRELRRLNLPHIDLGPTESDGKVDYVDYAAKLCAEMEKDWAIAARFPEHASDPLGVIICGTGAGMLIVANMFKGIRAVLCIDAVSARLAREHNDSNVLVLGSWHTPLGKVPEVLSTWLDTPFENGRHSPRLAKLAAIEVENMR